MPTPAEDDAAAVARLTAPDPRLGVPIPAYGGRSLPNVGASVVAAVGLADVAPPPLAPPLAADLDPFHGRRAEGPVVVLLADGFGWNSFATWRATDRSDAARRWSALARPITTIFPTTTTAALVSLSTATSPSRHGIVGYRQFLPRFGVVADLLRMAPVGVAVPESLVGPDWSPDLISGAPSIFRRGVRGVAVSRDRFEGSALTRLLYDGAEFVPYATASDLAHQLIDQLERPTPPPVVYAYWDELDTVHHLRGPHDRLFAFEADRLAHLVAYVAR
ncbi:MAG TPA: alkaline phosphatase family protein, partial [Thermoplasmata archaeon]|nr:alkaline phosphatase family protein [Thermoplasmata archaeon]